METQDEIYIFFKDNEVKFEKIEDSLTEELRHLEHKSIEDNRNVELLKKISSLKKIKDVVSKIVLDCMCTTEFIDDVADIQPYLIEIEEQFIDTKKSINKYLQLTTFNTEDDSNCIVSINAGQGGTEAEDWVGMLFRMYLRWCDSHKFKTDVINMIHSMEANEGLKKVDFTIEGTNVYALLKNEIGIHRLIRKSPFDKNNARHTSFASVDVIQEVNDNINIEVSDNDVRIDVTKGHGAGGQHRNKTSSAIRLLHYETNIVVFCQSDRSQHRNKENAFKILKSRLYELEKNKQEELKAKENGEKPSIGWGNKIRSYVQHPEQRVKDHRTGITINSFDDVMNGKIDEFIYGSLI